MGCETPSTGSRRADGTDQLYLSQSIICTLIFYGYGLGFFGKMGAAIGILLTFAIYLLQIPFSHWWMKRFQYGPAEWLWRSLTYRQRQPLRRPS